MHPHAELLRAVELAVNGNWDDAHRTVQNSEDPYACWIHAVLHKIEGDERNSRYWYRRAGRPFDISRSHREELEEIKGLLTSKGE